MSSLLKSKTDEKKDVEALIEAYIDSVSASARKKSETFLSDMLVYLVQTSEMPQTQLLEIIDARLSQLAFDIPTEAIEAIYVKTAADAVSASFVFDKVDADAIKAMHQNFFWLKEDGTERMQELVRGSIEEAFLGKIPAQKLGAHLREKFGGIAEDTERYFQGVTDHIIRQSQNIARVRQYEKNGVKFIRVDAVIDGKTSAICRSLNGRIIPIGHVTAQVEKIMAARTIEEKKEAAPWPSDPLFVKTLPKNIGLAPYHFRCRTRNSPYYPSKADFVDEFGRACELPKDVRKKIDDKHKKDSKRYKGADNLIRATLGHIVREGVHLNDGSRVILGSNGVIMFIRNGKIGSAYKAKVPSEYFEQNVSKTIYDKLNIKKGNGIWNVLSRLNAALRDTMSMRENGTPSGRKNS